MIDWAAVLDMQTDEEMLGGMKERLYEDILEI
jgi:hypothetical protein